MSEAAAPPDPDENVLVFAAPETDHTNAHVAFRLSWLDAESGTIVEDEEVLHAVRPKMAALLKIVRQVGDLDTMEDLSAATALDDVMRKVLTPESVAYLEARFDDDDDDLDLDVLGPVMENLMGLWYRRPTGGSPASSPSPSRTGKRSTVRRPSRG